VGARYQDATPLSWRQVHAFRLARHHLDRPASRSALAAVTDDVCGVQAQVLSAAQLALRARIRGLTPEDVERALWRDRTLVKTWCMRGAVHLVPASEFETYVRGVARRESRSTGWLVRAGLSRQEVDRTVDAIHDALADGPLLRQDLARRVSRAVGPRVRRWVGHSWGGAVLIASLRGRACFGPNRGREVTFVRPEDWIPGWRTIPAEEAETNLLRKYLRAYGPATPLDFSMWTNFTVADARAIWERLERDLVTVEVDGRAASALRSDLPVLRRAPPRPGIRLLPSFDEYLLGHKDKGHLVDPAHYKRVYRKAGWLSPVVLVDGRVAGVWSAAKSRGRLTITVEPFRRLGREIRDGVAAEADDVGRFFGLAAEVRYA